MKEDGERAECLRICEEIRTISKQLRDNGHAITFTKDMSGYKTPKGRKTNYNYNFKLCMDILEECEKILDAGFNPEFTCENKQLQQYVESTGQFPDHATLLGLRYKGARKGGSR